jgi:hypothetical protein
MLVELVKDTTGAFVIACGNRPLTAGAVENQQVELCISPALTANQQRLYTPVMATFAELAGNVEALTRRLESLPFNVLRSRAVQGMD